MELVKKQQQSAAVSVLTNEHIELIKDMYFKGSSNEEFQMFLHVCKKTGLDPAMRQIFPVKRWDSKLKKEVMTVQTGIDGYRLIAERTGRYAPGREPTYQYEDGKVLSATAYVKKQTADGTWHEIAATAFYDEYVQKTKEGTPTQFWQKMAHNQLAKCAEALALRKAFPGDLSGIYTQEEMAQADVVDVTYHAEKKEGKITAEEAEELEAVLKDCDPAYVKRVMDGLKMCKPPVNNIKDLPERMYGVALERAIANREKYLYSYDVDVIDEYEEAIEA